MKYKQYALKSEESQLSEGVFDTSNTYTSESSIEFSELEKYESMGYATSNTTESLRNYVYNLPNNFDILREIEFKKDISQNSNIFKSVLLFVSVLQDVLIKNRFKIKRSSNLPPLEFKWLEDNSVLIEWIFKDFRIGFSIEEDSSESGWYLVTNENLREFSASGALDVNNIEPLFNSLLKFALANS